VKLFLRDEVFDRGGTELLGFFAAVWDGRHAVALEEQGHQFGRWLGARSSEDQEYVKLAIQTSYGSLSKVVVDVARTNVSDWDSDVVSIQDALSLVRLPYRILVENNNSDRRFLMAIANDEQRNVLKNAERQRRIEFVQGGGLREVKRIIDEDIQNDRGRLKITFVIIDSDALLRGKMHRYATDVHDLCQQYKIPCHVLRRRSTENYLTKYSLERHLNNDPNKRGQREKLYEAFMKLRPHQRYHYHMKDGFKKPHHCRVFASVGVSDIDVLWRGWDWRESESIGYLFGSDVREHDLLREGAMRELGPLMRKLVAHLG